MIIETSASCQYCGKENFIRYGTDNISKWQVCPHCGLSEARRIISGEEDVAIGDNALSIFLCLGNQNNAEDSNKIVKKFFSGRGEGNNIYIYTHESMKEHLTSRQSLLYWDKDNEPYVAAMWRRLRLSKEPSFLDNLKNISYLSDSSLRELISKAVGMEFDTWNLNKLFETRYDLIHYVQQIYCLKEFLPSNVEVLIVDTINDSKVCPLVA